MRTIPLAIILFSFNAWGQDAEIGFYAEAIRSQNVVKENHQFYQTVENRDRFGFALGANLFVDETDRSR